MKRSFLLFVLFANALFANAQTKTIVYFDSNKSVLKPDALKVLDSLADVLRQASNYQMEIDAHCDNTGDDKSNQILSERRSNAVLNYFKDKNPGKQSITVKSFGESYPTASNDNEAGKAMNRRAEISVTITLPGIVTPPVVANQKTFNEKSTLTDLEVGKTLVLKNLNFEGGTAVLLPEGRPTLEMLLRTMQDNPTLEIEIGGHVCCYDDMPLSILRAQSVYNYLVRKGISKDRLTYKGYSRNKPIVEDDRDEANARLNRRVEITVLKK